MSDALQEVLDNLDRSDEPQIAIAMCEFEAERDRPKNRVRSIAEEIDRRWGFDRVRA